jgi:DNA-binding NtrC family response regulator
MKKTPQQIGEGGTRTPVTEMPPEPPAIVIADDDWGTRMIVALNLEPDGYEVRSASSARELEQALADGRARLVLLDIRMGGDNGIEIARRLLEERPEVAVVFLTGASYLLTAAENDLAHELIDKPFTIERLRATVARLCPLEQRPAHHAGSDGPEPVRSSLERRAS